MIINQQADLCNLLGAEKDIEGPIGVSWAQGDRLMVGHAAMRPAYAALFANSVNLHAEVPTHIREGDFVVDEERVTGLPGKPEPLHAVVVYRLREGLIVHVRMFT